MLYRICAGLLLLATLGHTLGGMLGTARTGPRAGAEADRVFRDMQFVHFTWQGADTTWFKFWLGNGLCVSALFLPAIVAADRVGDTGRHRADVVARVQVLRSPRRSGVWSHHDSDRNRDLHSLEVEAIGLDLVDQGRARDSELHRGSRAVPGVMSQRPFDVLPLDFRQRLRRVAPVARRALSQISW